MTYSSSAEYQREYRKKHPEIKREADRRYYNKKWREENKEYYKGYNEKRKERGGNLKSQRLGQVSDL